MMIGNNYYKTTDTALATYLITEGFIPTEIDYSTSRYVFVFSETCDVLQPYENRYVAGKAKVDPAHYNRIYRKLLRVVKNNLQWWGA